jgi:hypothetical protein
MCFNETHRKTFVRAVKSRNMASSDGNQNKKNIFDGGDLVEVVTWKNEDNIKMNLFSIWNGLSRITSG